ncbi:MAG: hypothetical protein IPL74_05625 [Bacteroidetes bacterium]|nr:hypothetical protein [Bacteroidota bacterium]
MKRFLRVNNEDFPLCEEEYFATDEQHPGATFTNGTSEYFSGIVFYDEFNRPNKFRKFL